MAELSEEVERFIAEHVDALEQLEILLLLRSQRTREFAPAEVTEELRLGPNSAPERLAGLAARGLLRTRGEPARFRYAPESAETERIVGELARCYAERRVSVIARIFSPRAARGPSKRR